MNGQTSIEMPTYQQVCEQLSALESRGICLGLARMQRLMAKLGDPQEQLQFVHIAGTNGKGSTATMLAKIMQCSGYRTGLFTSPEVLELREYLQIDGEMISQEDFTGCAKRVLTVADAWEDEDRPTLFEVKTAIAFVWFLERQCDIVCLEAGLGGAEDSTNVIPPPLLQIITAIDMDHVAILGPELSDIARAKAGIIKGGITVSYLKQPPEALQVLRERCRDVGSKLLLPAPDKLKILQTDWRFGCFCYDGVEYQKALAGEFQVYNALTAITAARALREIGWKLTEEAVQSGLQGAVICARLEVLSERPLGILDGSHNPQAMRALKQTLQALRREADMSAGRKLTLLMGVLADKGYREMLSSVVPLTDRFLAVSPSNPRALPAAELAVAAKAHCQEVHFYDDHAAAVQAALADLAPNDVLVVCGSLYLAADVRPILTSKELEKI